MDPKVKELREAYNAAVQRMNEAADGIAALDAEASDETIDAAETAFADAKSEVERCKRNMERHEEILEARDKNPQVEIPEDEPAKVPARAKGSTKEEATYRVDTVHETSFLRDLIAVKHGDSAARERLERNRKEAVDRMPAGSEWRDMGDSSTAGAEFVPDQYLGQLWVGPAVGGRPFVDALPRLDLPTTGTTIDVPKLSSGVTAAARASGGSVSETDGVTATVSHDVIEIAGQVDIDRIAVMRSNPPIDMVIGQALQRRYFAACETEALAGDGSGNHDGLRNVSGANAVTYTDASPTVAELLPKLYDAIQQNWDGRKGETAPDTIVYHPRRAAWMASSLSSTFPLFPQAGAGTQALGSQNRGLLQSPLGLNEIVSPHVGTTYGAGTNEDEIYILNSADLIWMEGPLMARVFEDVGSGTGAIRFQVFGHSAFLSNLYPEAIAVISGTGLAAPSFA